MSKKLTNGLLQKLSITKGHLRSKISHNEKEKSSPESRVNSLFFKECHAIDSFDDVLNIPTAQLYFIQFMEYIDQLNLIKFYLHVNSYKASFECSTNDPETLKTDACNIYSQFLCANALSPIGLSDHIRRDVIDKMCQIDGSIRPDCFGKAQSYALDLLENRYFKEFLASIFYAKYLYELYTSSQLTVIDILKMHSILCAFLEFLESHEDNYGRNLLEFIISVRDIRQSTSEHILIDDAMVIYDKYFSMQAANNLKFGDAMRVEIESKICTESGHPDPNVFLKPYNLACAYLQENYIPQFIKSPYFEKIVQNLFAKIEYTIVDSKRENEPQPTNGGFLSHPGSLLAIPTTLTQALSFDKSPQQPIRSLSSTASDEAETLSVGSLSSASRKNMYNNIARVDELGRYESLFDKEFCAEEELYGRRMIKSVIDKYLHQSAEEANKQAEEAARVIISEVQNMVSIGNALQKDSLTMHN